MPCICFVATFHQPVPSCPVGVSRQHQSPFHLVLSFLPVNLSHPVQSIHPSIHPAAPHSPIHSTSFHGGGHRSGQVRPSPAQPSPAQAADHNPPIHHPLVTPINQHCNCNCNCNCTAVVAFAVATATGNRQTEQGAAVQTSRSAASKEAGVREREKKGPADLKPSSAANEDLATIRQHSGRSPASRCSSLPHPTIHTRSSAFFLKKTSRAVAVAFSSPSLLSSHDDTTLFCLAAADPLSTVCCVFHSPICRPAICCFPASSFSKHFRPEVPSFLVSSIPLSSSSSLARSLSLPLSLALSLSLFLLFLLFLPQARPR
ncbi:hypothetical protein J3F83DRAFT_661464 [Trichoderma novae-zelandiae]